MTLAANAATTLSAISGLNLISAGRSNSKESAIAYATDGTLAKVHEFDPRAEDSLRFEVPQAAVGDAVDLEITLGGPGQDMTGSFLQIVGATLTQRHNAFPELTLDTREPSNGSFAGYEYVIDVDGLYFGVRWFGGETPAGSPLKVFGVQTALWEEISASWSIEAEDTVADNEGNHLESRIFAVRLGLTGTFTIDSADTPAAPAGWYGTFSTQKDQHRYQKGSMDLWKIFNVVASS